MKKLFTAAAVPVVMIAAAFFVAGCSDEPAQAPVEEPPVAEVTETLQEDAAEAVEEAADEVQEVVEESASVEEESSDEPIVLALADDTPVREWRFREGRDYFRLMPTQPTVGGADKIEVAKLFMYSCPHCADLDPVLSQWAANADPGVRFVRVPVIFNRVAQLHSQLYYTAELLSANGQLADWSLLHQTVFIEFHQRNNRLLSVDAIQRLFARFGVSPDDFQKAWNSFPVNQKLRVAADLTRRYGVDSVPSVVVNGKYRVPNNSNMTAIIDELLAREGLN